MSGTRTTYRYGTVHKKAFTTSAAIDTAISTGVYQVRVYVTGDAHIAVGESPTAAVTDTPIAADLPEYIDVNPGEKIAAVQQSGGSGGDLYVTELSA